MERCVICDSTELEDTLDENPDGPIVLDFFKYRGDMVCHRCFSAIDIAASEFYYGEEDYGEWSFSEKIE